LRHGVPHVHNAAHPIREPAILMVSIERFAFNPFGQGSDHFFEGKNVQRDGGGERN
jgi:hypothetical protein